MQRVHFCDTVISCSGLPFYKRWKECMCACLCVIQIVSISLSLSLWKKCIIYIYICKLYIYIKIKIVCKVLQRYKWSEIGTVHVLAIWNHIKIHQPENISCFEVQCGCCRLLTYRIIYNYIIIYIYLYLVKRCWVSVKLWCLRSNLIHE